MIKVLFFGMLAQKIKTREAELEVQSGATLSDVMAELRERFPDLPETNYVYAVNEEQRELTSPVNDGDEVAVMPPFAGG